MQLRNGNQTIEPRLGRGTARPLCRARANFRSEGQQLDGVGAGEGVEIELLANMLRYIQLSIYWMPRESRKQQRTGARQPRSYPIRI